MIRQALLEILGCTDVKRAGSEPEKVDRVRALRREPLALAQGHPPRFGYQRIHLFRICRPQAMSKLTRPARRMAARHGLIRFAQGFALDLRSILLSSLRSGRRTPFSSMPVTQIAAQFGCPWWTAPRTLWSELGGFPRHFPRTRASCVNSLERMRRLSGHFSAADSLHSLQKSSP